MKERQIGIDVIKTLAIIFVVAGHFFINTDYYSEISGAEFVGLSVARRLFSISVPLFMICTGYLNLGKRPVKSYYKGGLRVIWSYLIVSAVTIAYEIYFNHVDHSVTEWLLKITDFTAIAYGWYIEMWIGLFLMVPFLNVLWGGLDCTWRKVWLLTLLMLTAVPAFVNRPGLGLLPDFWQMAYPLLFYYIGAYIREYRPTFSRKWLFVILLLICSANPMVNLLFNHVGSMHPGSPFGLVGVLLSTVLFLLCYQCDIRTQWLRKTFIMVSVCSLDMYLISYIFDNFCYSHFSIVDKGPATLAFIAVVPSVLIMSFVFAFVKARLSNLRK